MAEDRSLNQSIRYLSFAPSLRQEEGGVTRAVTDLCTVLANRGHRVTLLTLDDSDVPEHWTSGADRPTVLQLRSTALGSFIRPDTTSEVASLITETDVVHLHEPWILENRHLARLARTHGKPYVVTVHGMLDDWSMARKRFKKRFYLALGGTRFLERAARVHCTADAERQQAAKWFPRGRPVVLPLIFDTTPFRHLPGPDLAETLVESVPVGTPRILFLSRLHPKKGIELLIAAADFLHQRDVAFQLLLAGPGDSAYCEKLRQRVFDHGLNNHVQFLGMIRDRQKLSLYQLCDLFVLPSSQENFGLVLTEAMACGTPVVTTRGVDIWQELQCGMATIVDRTPADLAAAIERLLADPDALTHRGQKARAFVLDWLDPDKIACGYEAMYREVIMETSEPEKSVAARA